MWYTAGIHGLIPEPAYRALLVFRLLPLFQTQATAGERALIFFIRRFPVSHFVRTLLPIIGVILSLAVANAQQSPPPIPPETAQFDFWLGEWDAAWGNGLHGVNRISKRWDRVIVEEFDGKPDMPLEGHSVSAYDVNAKQWKQTWVDNEGGYLDFSGGFADGKMTLGRSFQRDGKTIQQRMVWYDITADAFSWNWERSLDAGKSWEVMWKIAYTRRK